MLAIPAVVLLGNYVFDGKQYAFLSLSVAILSCIPFFLRFERGENGSIRLVLIAVLTALSVLGRLLFAALPGFKPVTAMVILTAMYFGSEAGFLTGALTAVLSNFYFGQGPWTPFQMFAWGMVGLLAGLFAKQLRASRVWLCVFGALSGVVYSVLMDVWTVLWYGRGFSAPLYLAALATALPHTALYAASNVIYLALFARPFGEKLERLRVKYGI